MSTNAKYLRVTIHDNDFTVSLEFVCETLYNVFRFENKYPTETDLPYVAEMIKHIWVGVKGIQNLLRWQEYTAMNLDYLTLCLEFVDFLDIPEWDNAESIYIPMFDGAEIITR